VQLIDATAWFRPLRKNLGKKNCELGPEDIQRISDTYLKFEETPQSKIFPNAAFGYWKVMVERPLRLRSQFSAKAIKSLRFASGDEDLRSVLYDVVEAAHQIPPERRGVVAFAFHFEMDGLAAGHAEERSPARMPCCVAPGCVTCLLQLPC